jgi:hypothetical protein
MKVNLYNIPTIIRFLSFKLISSFDRALVKINQYIYYFVKLEADIVIS